MSERYELRWIWRTPVGAVLALRWNYRWRGVAKWLRASPVLVGAPPRAGRGWWLVLRYPGSVVANQAALAEGVTS